MFFLRVAVVAVVKLFAAFGWQFMLGMAANEGTITRAVGSRTLMASSQTLTRRDVSDEIFWKEPPRATLLQVVMGSQRVIQDARFFEWLEEDLDQRYITVTAVNGLILSVSDSDIITVFPGMTVGRSQAISARVTAVSVQTNGTSTATVDSVAGIAAQDKLLLGAPDVEEYSSEPTALTRQPAVLSNNMVTVRSAWGLTGFAMTDDWYGEIIEPRQRERAKLQHKISLDVEAWIGRQPAAQLTLNGRNIMYTDGVLSQITSNVTAIPGGVLNWQTLNAIAEGFERLMGTDAPYLFMSRAVHAILANVAYGKWAPADKRDLETEWGLETRSLHLGSKRYKCLIVDHWAGPDFGTMMVAIDSNELTLRSVEYKAKQKGFSGLRWMIEYMRGMDITGVDGTTGCFLTDMGVRVRNEQGGWVLTGVTGY